MTATIFARHEVQDFDAFKALWDASDAFHAEHGVLSAGLHRDIDNPNLLSISSQFASVEAAKAFAEQLEGEGFNEGPVKIGTVIPETVQYWICEDI